MRVNADAFTPYPSRHLPIMAMQYGAENPDQRIARRHLGWTPVAAFEWATDKRSLNGVCIITQYRFRIHSEQSAGHRDKSIMRITSLAVAARPFGL
jgi:hypothetical protein